MSGLFNGSVLVDANPNSSVTSAVETVILERYDAGNSPAKIGKALGLGTGAVRSVLKRLGATPRPRRPASGPHEQAILSQYAAGRTIKQISAEFGLNFATVYR